MNNSEIAIIFSSEWYTYNALESNCLSNDRRCINGKVTGSNKCVGYCQYYGHPGFLTKEQRKQHDCIRKKCDYYVEKQKKTTFG